MARREREFLFLRLHVGAALAAEDEDEEEDDAVALGEAALDSPTFTTAEGVAALETTLLEEEVGVAALEVEEDDTAATEELLPLDDDAPDMDPATASVNLVVDPPQNVMSRLTLLAWHALCTELSSGWKNAVLQLASAPVIRLY